MSAPAFATTRSTFESRLKSPAASECGWSPTGIDATGADPPVPLPSRTETLSELMFAVARSIRPSRLKSALTIEWGSRPTATGEPAAGTKVGPAAYALAANATPTKQPITIVSERRRNAPQASTMTPPLRMRRE